MTEDATSGGGGRRAARAPATGGAIAIFVKTPGYSAVKTRLADVVGSDIACAWHLRAAAAVAEVAASAAREVGATAYFAVAEEAALDGEPWRALPCLWQGEGGLGARMGRVHDMLVARHGIGVLIGADAPQLAASMLADALAWCAASAPRQAIGPASDGGFWLYAGNRLAPLTLWKSVPYSSADTAACFRAAFGAYGPFAELPRLTDVDRAHDFAAVRRELAALAAPTAAQYALAEWVASVDPAGRGRGAA